MPTVWRMFGLRVVIYPNDHRPAHVHVIGGGCEAVFNLNCSADDLSRTPEVRENYGFDARSLEQIEVELAEQSERLCAAWRNYHGDA
jgi:hypothetical protein